MSARDIFWFLAGVLAMAAVAIAALPWLRENSSVSRALRALPRWAWALVPLAIGVAAGVYLQLGAPDSAAVAPANTGVTAVAAAPESSNAAVASAGASAGAAAGGVAALPAGATNAAPMSQAIAGLESKLAKGGGSADDWELLAKSYEFLGRPDDAALARQHKLPAASGGSGAAAGAAAMPAAAAAETAAPAAGARISGEIQLADALRAKVKPGMTLYILAKGVGMPGAPVAVYRTTTSRWPLAFELSDANAMLPGRNLSSAAQVTVEARISLSGLANSQPGDLLGSAGPLAPAGSKPLRLVIQKVVE